MDLGIFKMGIITEAVISNLKLSLEKTTQISNDLSTIESCCSIGFREPFGRRSVHIKLENAKNAIAELQKDLSSQLELERKYE
jgi:hypothetical protein